MHDEVITDEDVLKQIGKCHDLLNKIIENNRGKKERSQKDRFLVASSIGGIEEMLGVLGQIIATIQTLKLLANMGAITNSTASNYMMYLQIFLYMHKEDLCEDLKNILTKSFEEYGVSEPQTEGESEDAN